VKPICHKLKNFVSQNLFLILAVMCIMAALVCNDVEDTLVHHYKISRFYDYDCSYWDGNCQGKEVGVYWNIFGWKIQVWKFWVDAWHLFKIIRIWMVTNILFLMWVQLRYRELWIFNISCFRYIKNFWLWVLKRYALYELGCMLVVYYFHIWFYGGLFLR